MKIRIMNQKTPTKHLLLSGLAIAISALNAFAQTNSALPADNHPFSLDDHFRSGWHEGTAGAGVMFSPFTVGPGRPTVNYAFGYVQAGYMLNNVGHDGFFRGNWELAPEAFGAGIWHRTGHYIAGWTLLLRYNFVPRGWRLTPFIEGGGGTVFTDISHQYDGQNFNFNLEASGGARYFIKRNVSINAEYRYQHISNANTGSRNIGINATGPVVGVSWFF